MHLARAEAMLLNTRSYRFEDADLVLTSAKPSKGGPATRVDLVERDDRINPGPSHEIRVIATEGGEDKTVERFEIWHGRVSITDFRMYLRGFQQDTNPAPGLVSDERDDFDSQPFLAVEWVLDPA